MTQESITVFLPHPEPIRSMYQQSIQERHPECLIRAVTTPADLKIALKDTDVLIVYGGNLGAHPDLFNDAPRLRWLHALTSGVDGIIDNPSLPSTTIVSATRGLHGPAMAELCFLIMLGLARGVHRMLTNQQDRRWERWPGSLLHRKTIGILGVGQIAADLAPRCKAFGMHVVGISRTLRDLPGFDEMRLRDDLGGAVADLDFLVLLIPLSADTRRIVDARIIDAMKPTSYIINLARGGVLDEEALLTSLHDGRIAGAGLDTFVTEPLPSESPLWSAPRLIVTPHLGGLSDVYIRNAIALFSDNLACLRQGAIQNMKNLEKS